MKSLNTSVKYQVEIKESQNLRVWRVWKVQVQVSSASASINKRKPKQKNMWKRKRKKKFILILKSIILQVKEFLAEQIQWQGLNLSIS